MTTNQIKPGPVIVQDFITSMEADPNVDPEILAVIRKLLMIEGKVSPTKLQRELGLLRKG